MSLFRLYFTPGNREFGLVGISIGFAHAAWLSARGEKNVDWVAWAVGGAILGPFVALPVIASMRGQSEKK